MLSVVLLVCCFYHVDSSHCEYKHMDSDNGWVVNVCTFEMNGTNAYYVKDTCTSNTTQIRTKFNTLSDCENNINGVDDTDSI